MTYRDPRIDAVVRNPGCADRDAGRKGRPHRRGGAGGIRAGADPTGKPSGAGDHRGAVAAGGMTETGRAARKK